MEAIQYLYPVVAFLGAGFLVLFVSRLVKISPIVGFIAAGFALGPHVAGLIPDNKTTHLLAELGVVFLLFDIGLNLSVKSAWKMRRDMFGIAPVQVLLTTLVFGVAAFFIFASSGKAALVIGLTLALSSTAVVMAVLRDLKMTESPIGGSAKAIIIFQDLAAIFILIFADTLGQG